MADLTTLDAVKAWIGQKPEATADDELLTRMIAAASAFIVGYCGRSILEDTYLETRDGTGGARLQLRAYPVLAVASLSIDGVAIAAAVTATDFGYLVGRTALTLRGYRFTRGLSNVVVSYSAGYDEVPADVEQACCELIGLRYKERDRIGFVSKSLAGETVTFSVKDMTDSIRSALSSYRTVAPA